MLGGRFKTLLKDIFFPIFCAECGAEGEWWCEKCCREKNKFISQNAAGFLNGTAAFLSYEDKVIAHLIKQFKYNGAWEMQRLWKRIVEYGSTDLVKFIKQNITAKTDQLLVVPVPLHKRRERERGFNQAQIIAEIIIEILAEQSIAGQLDKALLVRKNYTNQQAKLGKEERTQNVLEAFACQKDIYQKNILLVDDVYTTGATMQECGRILRQSGANTILGLTLARG